MPISTRTLDLEDRLEEITERLTAIEEEKEDILRQTEEYERENPQEGYPAELEDEWEDVDNEESELAGEKRKFIETMVRWRTDFAISEDTDFEEVLDAYESDVEDCTFEVAELTFGQLQRVSDDMMEESFEVDAKRGDLEGTPKQGFYQIELLREAIVGQPEGAPTRMVKTSRGNVERPAPESYPIPVAEWLFDKVDAINTTGDTEMGNSSLKEAMKLRNSGRN